MYKPRCYMVDLAERLAGRSSNPAIIESLAGCSGHFVFLVSMGAYPRVYFIVSSSFLRRLPILSYSFSYPLVILVLAVKK